MEFRRLRLAGFKSFVEPAELRIEPGLTGVVGPNGCGKSNLLEALRWVMGEGSPKSMRSGGMDDVIFAGTGTRPARSLASVTLVLSGAAGEEIEVQRKIERGAGSDYRVNGRDTRAQDVRLLFADSATGAHSPAIVGQGRIGAIIAAKPAERRVLLEEAAGIAGLHVRKREAEIRLRAAEANVSRLDDVVRGLEAQAAALKRQARVAERYKALSERLKIAEAQVVYARWLAAKAGAATAREAAAAAERQADGLTRIAAALSTEVANATAALPALRLAEAEAAAALQALNQRRALLDAEGLTIAARLEALERDRAAIDRDLAREAGLADDATAADARLATEAAVLGERLAAGAKRLPELRAAVAAAETGAGKAETALNEALAAHAAAAAEARAAGDALAAAEARAVRAKVEADRLAALRARLQPAADTAPLTAAVEAATQALAAADRLLVDAEAARPDAEAARAEAVAAAAAARSTLAALTAEADALARRLAADSAKGDRIADRISVEAGLEAALAAALGDDLDAGGADSGAARRWGGLAPTAPPAQAELVEAGSNSSVKPGFDKLSLSGGSAELPFPGDPDLHPDVRPLAAAVTAPPELARRLAQIGIASAADAPALAASLASGQRLVTPEGALYRWDGFIDMGGRSDAAAARLRARRRAGEVADERDRVDATRRAADVTLATADASHNAALAAERNARAARAEAVRSVEAARARLAAAETAAARSAGEAETLAAAEARAAEALSTARAEAEALRARTIDRARIETLSIALSKARAAADTARAMLATTRAEADRALRDAEAENRRSDAIAADRSGWSKRVAASAAQQAALADRDRAAVAEGTALVAREAEVAAEVAGLATRTAEAAAARGCAADALATADAALAATNAQARAADEAVAAAREARAAARAEADHQEAARLEIERQCGERFQCPPPVLADRFGFVTTGGDPATLAEEADALSAERERLGPVNLRAAIELAELEEQAATTSAEKAELDTAIARLRGSIGNLNREGRARLSEAFHKVDAHFRSLFTTLFGGGEARLELIESDDPLEAGLEIMAQPPGKKLQSLTLLSGGEQALTATALIFGLFLANPAPICVLDEVDAPLDDANVERFCDLLDRMADDTDTRFLIVTHNAVTMSRMHRLYGVTMGEPGVSQLVSVDLQGAERLLATG